VSSKRMGVGVIGAGVISRYYLENMTRFPDLNVLAVADLEPARARARAQEFGLRPMLVPELLGSEDIQIVLNLTVPAAHFDVSARILVSGKSDRACTSASTTPWWRPSSPTTAAKRPRE
jgi:predicted dehydrogenase